MKRLFPRAVAEAVGLVGLVVLANAGCDPDQSVKPGAPVLTMMSIVEPDGTRFDVTPEAAACEPGLKDGDSCDPEADSICHTAEADWCKCMAVPEPTPPEEPPCTPEQEADAGSGPAPADGGADTAADAAATEGGSDAAAAEGGSDAGAADAAEEAGSDAGAADAAEEAGSDAGAADAAAGETAAPKGTWSCKAFAPGSKVIATFDRLLDSAPLVPDDGESGRSDIATATVKTAVTPAPKTVTDYTPNGSTGGLIFPLFGENPGPNLAVMPDPSWPTSNTVTVALSKSKVRAKDGKTPFESSGAIIDGVLSFKTVAFSAGVTVPPNAFPPAEETDAGTENEADASDAGTDAASDDASDAAAEAAAENPDACVPPPEPTTALADMTPVTIAFNTAVDPAEIVEHVTIMAGGKDYSDQVDITADAASVTITPKTTWAKSTTFVVIVDDKAVDVFGGAIAAAAKGTFTTGDK